jgi:hypothetical protein
MRWLISVVIHLSPTYEARVQAIINYHATVLGERVNKEQARTMRLTREQYLEVSTLVVVDIND